MPYIGRYLLLAFFSEVLLCFGRGAGRLLHGTARPFQASNFWVLFILRHQLILSGAVGQQRVEIWMESRILHSCVQQGPQRMLADGLVLSRIRALSHMMQAEPAGSRCLEEEELRSASSPFLFKSPRRIASTLVASSYTKILKHIAR